MDKPWQMVGLVATLAFFGLGLLKSKGGLHLCIFLIPFEGINFSSIGGLGVTAVLVVAYFMGYVSYGSRRIGLRNVPYVGHIALIFFSLGISLLSLFFFTDLHNILFGYGSEGTLLLPALLAKYLLNITSAIMLYVLISVYVKTPEDTERLMRIFSYSIVFLFITWLGSFKYDFKLPAFLQTVYAGSGSTFNYLHRFAGYDGEYGLLAEYFFVVLVFSSYSIQDRRTPKKLKPIFLAIALVAIIISIDTGTRAFVGVMIVFSIAYFYHFSRRAKTSLIKKGLVLIVLVATFSATIYLSLESYLLERIDETIETGEALRSPYQLDNLLNRPYIAAFSDVVEVGGIFGAGPFNMLGVKGNWMAYHSLYYDLLIKFGVLGLVIYLIFYFRLLRDIKRKMSNEMKTESTLSVFLFGLMLSLLIGEYARSYQNQTSFILMYWFLFGLIGTFNRFETSHT